MSKSMKTVFIVLAIVLTLCICCALTFFAFNWFIRNQELTAPEDRILQDYTLPWLEGEDTPSRPTSSPTSEPTDTPGY